jgi:hypothetical protein
MTDFADAARAATVAMRDLFPPTPLQKNATCRSATARKSG